MRKTKSPFKDNKLLKQQIQEFLSSHRATFAQEVNRTSCFFELAVFNDLVRYYETNGYLVSPQNLRKKNRQFVYALSPSAKPENCSYFLAEKRYIRRDSKYFEIRHNLRIQSAHNDDIFVSPDYAIIDGKKIRSTKVPHYYNGKADYFYIESKHVRTFAETKHYYPSPELVLNFVGLVNEIMPPLIEGNVPSQLPRHFGPSLFVSGVGNVHINKIKKSLAERYKINVFLGLFAYPSQLYSSSNQPRIEKIGNK